LKLALAMGAEVKTDAEMALRRWSESESALDEMQNTVEETEKALKKDRSNKDLVKKAELAKKAIEKQSRIHQALSEDAMRIFNVASDGDEAGALAAFHLEQVETVKASLDRLWKIAKLSRSTR
jgi:methyl coenzyme M reductase subunit C-like uncharacterized protein (methanogenesis marker protein 7)